MSSIKEEEVRVFIDAVERYFQQLTGIKPNVNGAYLSDDGAPPNYGLTGLIELSGSFRGCIYFSAPRAMVRHLLIAIRENDHSEENLLDTVGELANTIAGNARKYFGETMDISIPTTMSGAPEVSRPSVRARPYIISIDWRNYMAALVVDIERAD